MQETPFVVMEKQDRIFVESLREVGFRKNVAKALTYLAKVRGNEMKNGVGEATSREMEIGAGMRQPEVSTAVNELKDQGWVEEREINREGKGRPRKCYRLKKPIGYILDSVEDEKVDEVKEELDTIDELRGIHG